MSDIVGIGAAVFDTVMTAGEFPREDTKLQAISTLTQGGGPCATALCAAAKLGVSTAYLGSVGDDDYGTRILADFRARGVNADGVRVRRGCVSFHAFVLINTSASTRTVVWNRGTVPSPMPDELDMEAVKSAKALHLDGNHIEAAICASRAAKSAGVTVSMDAGANYPGVDALLPFVDVLIPSEEFAQKATGLNDTRSAAKALYARHRPRVFAVTQGSRGGFLYDGHEFWAYPAFPVEVADSCGAGDVFHGSFLACFVQGMPAAACARFASATAAIKCMSPGSRAGLPDRARVEAFLKERRVSL